MSLKTLSPMQEAFCQFMMEVKTKTEAARLAGYSESSPDKAASRLLEMPHIKARLEELRQERSMTTSLSAAQVVSRLNVLSLKCEMAKEYSVAYKCLDRLLSHLAPLGGKTALPEDQAAPAADKSAVAAEARAESADLVDALRKQKAKLQAVA